MKNILDYIQDSPRLFITFLGISQRDFESLVKPAEQAQETKKVSSESTQHRVNAKGAGRPAKLDLSERLALCLVYLRHNPTFEMLALLSGVSRSQAHQTFHENLKWIFNYYRPVYSSNLSRIQSYGHSIKRFYEMNF